MSKQIISNRKISYKISKSSEEYSTNGKNVPKEQISQTRNMQIPLVTKSELSTGNMQQRSLDNQSICTCGKWKTDTHSTYIRTIQTDLKSDVNCTYDEGKDMSLCNCNKKDIHKITRQTKSNNSQNIIIQDSNYCNSKENQNINLTSENDEKILNTNITTDANIKINTKINKKVCICGKGEHYLDINTTTSNDVQLDTIETKDNEEQIEEISKIRQEQIKIKKEEIIEVQHKKEKIEWTGDLFIQVMERIQYLAAEPPKISVQFLNDIMINRTINNEPIHILVPVPDNLIQKQGYLEVLAEEKQKEELCPENIELLNISNAYSIQVPSFDDLEIENYNIFIQSQPKILLIEQYSLYCQGEKKEKNPLQIENKSWDISATGKMWSGPIQPVKTNKLGVEEERKNWNDLVKKEKVEQLDFDNIPSYYRFKTIEIGDNEVISLKAKKRVLKDYTQTEESKIKMGGNGFKPRVWEPVPFLANSMTIERKITLPQLEKTSNDFAIDPMRKRRQDWNLVNTTSSETNINYLTEEKILEKQNLNPIEITQEKIEKNKWKEIVRKQNGVKLLYKKQKTPKWFLSISKEINLFFEHEIDDVIVNDDYNNIQGSQMRQVLVTILKVNEEEDETSSVTSYDVFQNVAIKKSNLNYEYGTQSLLKNKIEINKNIKTGSNYEFNIGSRINKISGTFGDGEFSKFGKNEGSIKLRMEENNKKSQYDKTVKNLVKQTKNLMGNTFEIKGRQIKIEYVRDSPEEENYLKV